MSREQQKRKTQNRPRYIPAMSLTANARTMRMKPDLLMLQTRKRITDHAILNIPDITRSASQLGANRQTKTLGVVRQPVGSAKE
jgi:hypothetical protein